MVASTAKLNATNWFMLTMILVFGVEWKCKQYFQLIEHFFLLFKNPFCKVQQFHCFYIVKNITFRKAVTRWNDLVLRLGYWCKRSVQVNGHIQWDCWGFFVCVRFVLYNLWSAFSFPKHTYLGVSPYLPED